MPRWRRHTGKLLQKNETNVSSQQLCSRIAHLVSIFWSQGQKCLHSNMVQLQESNWPPFYETFRGEESFFGSTSCHMVPNKTSVIVKSLWGLLFFGVFSPTGAEMTILNFSSGSSQCRPFVFPAARGRFTTIEGISLLKREVQCQLSRTCHYSFWGGVCCFFWERRAAVSAVSWEC